MRRLILVTFSLLALTGCYEGISFDERHRIFLYQYGLPIGRDISGEFKNIPPGKLLDNGLIETTLTQWAAKRLKSEIISVDHAMQWLTRVPCHEGGSFREFFLSSRAIGWIKPYIRL